MTPILVTTHIYDLAPHAFFTGTGPGSSDSFSVISYLYGLNTPIKILLEYGIFALLGYLALILTNARTQRQNALLIPSLAVLLFGGTYEHFAPVLFPILLITTVANLRET